MLFREEDIKKFQASKKTIKEWFQDAIDQFILEVPKQDRLGNQPPRLSLLMKEIYLYEPVQVERERLKGQGFNINTFVEVYNHLYPFLVSKYYTPKMIVNTVVKLVKEHPPHWTIQGIPVEDVLNHIVEVLIIEYIYSQDFEEIDQHKEIFGTYHTHFHREHWLTSWTQELYPQIKDRITMTPNFRYVFEFDEFADNLKHLSDIFDTIEPNAYQELIELKNGNEVRPSDYMLNKVRKIEDSYFFEHEILARFEFIHKPVYDSGTHYLIAPPLVQYLKFERNKKNWVESHFHIFNDADVPQYKFMVAHIGDRYFAQRGAGTSNCDHCNRVYMLTPKHTKHIRDIHHPTLFELEIIHEYNLKHDVYMGL